MNGNDYEKNSFSLNVTVENTYKKEDEIILKRNKRKSFIKANGIKNYGFDFDKEFNKYLFLCGEKIKKSQWKKLDDNDKFYTYEEWETSIKNKYTVYSMKALEQFYKYLNHCQRKIQPHKEFINPYVSALFTAVMTFYITVLCTETIDKKQISLNCEFVITLILLLVIVV
ncbi:MAG: hypothetical protein HFJ03_07930 [Lachnospira sp.]|nr:hypothetical protein [Lachnospira sp.]